MKQKTLLVLLLAFGGGCFEATPPVPGVDVRLPEVLPERVLVRNTSLLDVESGVVVPGRDVLLRDGVIAAIEPHGTLSGGLVIEAAGATLVPGLVDMHGHTYASSQASWDRDFPDPEANLRAYAYAGVTTVFDPADGSPDAFARRDRVARRELVGPRIFTTGPGLTCPDGHPIALVNELAPWWIAWYVARRAATPLPDVPTVNEVVDEIAAQGGDAVKIVVDSIPLQAPRMTREIAAAVVARARTHGLRVVAHIGTTQDAIDAADAGVALWVHDVYKERIPDDQIAKLAGYGIPMVATTEVFDRYARGQHGPIVPTRLERETVHASVLDAFWPIPEDFEVGALRSWLDVVDATMDARIDNVRRLHRAGVTILTGSDTQSGVFPGAGLHRELAHLVRAGMTPAQAIRAATLDPARWLSNGAEPDSGTVAVGKRADLMLVEGDPSADVAALQNIRQVFLAGVPIDRMPVSTP